MGHLHQLFPVALLGDRDVDGVARLMPGELGEKLRVLRFAVQEDVPGNVRRGGVVAVQKLAADLGKVGDLVEKVGQLVQQPPFPVLDHHSAGQEVVLGKGDNVQVLVGPQEDLLGGGDLLDGPDAVPEPGGLLEVQVLGGGFHLLFQGLHRGGAAVADVVDSLVDQGLVLLLAHLPHAEAEAPVDVVVQTGPPLAEFLGKSPGAAGQAEDPVGLVHTLLNDEGAGVGPQKGSIPGLLLGGGDPRVVPGGNVDVVIALVVLQQDVVLGSVELDETAFQHQSLKFAAGDDVVKVVDMGHHLPDFFGVGGIFPEVADYPVLQSLGLSHIDDLPLLVLHQVNAGLEGQAQRLLFQFFDGHDTPPFRYGL